MLRFLRHTHRDNRIGRRIMTKSRTATKNCACVKTRPDTSAVGNDLLRRPRSATEGRNGWPMSRLPNDPHRDFSASQSEDDFHAKIAELFASRTPGMLELFVDPIVRMKVGVLIAQAMAAPTKPQRRDKS